MNRRLALIFLKTSFAFLLLYWVWRSGYIDARALERLLQPSEFVILGLLVFSSLMAAVLRLHFLVRGVWPRLGFFKVFQLSFIGSFFNFCIPGGTGGDVLKSLMLAQAVSASRLQAIAFIFMDRLIGLFTMSLLGVIGISMRPDLLGKPLVLTIFVTLGSVLLFCLSLYKILQGRVRIGWLQSRVKRLRNSFALLRTINQRVSTRSTFIALGFSFGSQVLIILTLFLSARLFQLDQFTFWTYLSVAPAGMVIASLPITPAGIGVAQIAFVSLFKIFTGQTTEAGATVVTIYQIVLFLVSLLGMYFYIASDFRILKRKSGRNLDVES